MHVGDFSAADTVHLKFTMVDADGLPTTLGGTPALSVYKDDSTTESAAGITLTTDLDGKTGLNHVKITTGSAPTFYTNGSEYQVVITTGTIGGNSVAGYVVGSFSLGRGVNLTRWLGVVPINLLAGRVPSHAEVISDKSGYRLSAQGQADLVGTPMPESYAPPLGQPTLMQAIYMILQSINDIVIDGETISVKRRNGTTAFEVDLNSSTAPTSRRQGT